MSAVGAPFTGRSVPCAHCSVGGGGEVGVGQHDHVVLGAAQRLHSFAGLGGRLVDVAGDRRRAHEAHPRDIGVMKQRVDEQNAVITSCNNKKLDVQKVLEFFGQEAVARVVRESPKLQEPSAAKGT